MKRLVTAASALAIALGSLTATPAAAQSNQNRDALGLVLGLAAIGIIAHQVDKNRDKDKDDDKVSRNNYYYDDRYDDHRGRGHGRDDWRHDGRHDPRRDQHSDRRKLIPEQCVVETRTSNRWTSVVSEDCFRRVRGTGLPDACEFEIRTNRGRQDVYGMNCLQGRGYRIASR